MRLEDDAAHASTMYRRLMLILHPDKRVDSRVVLAGGQDNVNNAFERVQAALIQMTQRPHPMLTTAAAWATAQSGRCGVGGSSSLRVPRPPPPPPPPEPAGGDIIYAGCCGPMPPPHRVTGRCFMVRV